MRIKISQVTSTERDIVVLFKERYTFFDELCQKGLHMITTMTVMRKKTFVLDVGQISYHLWLRATLIISTLYDNETIYLLIYEYYVATTEENQPMATSYSPTSAIHGIGTRFPQTEEICVGWLGLPLNMGSEHDSRQLRKIVNWWSTFTLMEIKNGHEALIVPIDEIRIFVLDLQPIFFILTRNLTRSKGKNSVYSTLTYDLSAVKMCTKHDSRQIMKIMFWQSNY